MLVGTFDHHELRMCIYKVCRRVSKNLTTKICQILPVSEAILVKRSDWPKNVEVVAIVNRFERRSHHRNSANNAGDAIAAMVGILIADRLIGISPTTNAVSYHVTHAA